MLKDGEERALCAALLDAGLAFGERRNGAGRQSASWVTAAMNIGLEKRLGRQPDHRTPINSQCRGLSVRRRENAERPDVARSALFLDHSRLPI